MPQLKSKTTTTIIPSSRPHPLVAAILAAIFLGFVSLIAGVSFFQFYEKKYANRIFPKVAIGGVAFGGKTQEEVKEYWLHKNQPFNEAVFTFTFGDIKKTVTGIDLGLGYDATLSATQAFLVGRSGNFTSNIVERFSTKPINLSPYFRWRDSVLDDALKYLSLRINIPVTEALFQYVDGKVTAFKPSAKGQQINIAQTKKLFIDSIMTIPGSKNKHVTITMPVDIIEPTLTTDRVNTFGIKELIGRGYSEFAHSIPGRIHNVELASAKLNGILIKPGAEFSFNDALGDVSAETGFLPAYVIKEGHTVLGDGGGVCQVSTTFFRAAMAAGLPIVERHAHAYRVGYYEQAGYKPGIDATVFAPSTDLKIKNDTLNYILVQTKTNLNNLSLAISLYGTGDGRKSEIRNQQVWDLTPPPPDLYQDDPTLPAGTVKQVDFPAWGTKASFHYHVTRNGEILENTDFFSDFRPWQAVYLKGTL